MTFETTQPKEELIRRLQNEIEDSYWIVPYTLRNYEDNIKYGGSLSENGFTITRKTRRFFHTSLIFSSKFINNDNDTIDSTTIKTTVFPNPFLLAFDLIILLWAGYLLYRVIMLDLSQYQLGAGWNKLIVPGLLFAFIITTKIVSAFDEWKYYKRFMADIIEGK